MRISLVGVIVVVDQALSTGGPGTDANLLRESCKTL